MSDIQPSHSPRPVIQVALLWHSFFSSNLGVSALAHANMRIIAERADKAGVDVSFVLFGPRGDRAFPQPEEFGEIEYVEASSMRSAPAYRKLLLKADLVFDIGSGDSFAGIYGWRRFAKIAGLKFLVPEPRKRLVISPQTIGPFTNPIMRRLAALAMKRARLIAARDRESLDRARAMVDGETAKRLMLATDVAFSLDCLDAIPADFPAIDPARINVGLNVSGLLYGGGYTGDNQFGLALNYRELVKQFVGRLAGREDVQIWLISHVSRLSGEGVESDLDAARELAAEFPQLRLAPVFTGAREAKTFIAQMDIMYAARMHAAIGAVSTGTACIPMSYSLKFKSLFGGLGYDHLLDLKASHLDDALRIMLGAIDERETLAADARSAREASVRMLAPYREEIDRMMAPYAPR